MSRKKQSDLIAYSDVRAPQQTLGELLGHSSQAENLVGTGGDGAESEHGTSLRPPKSLERLSGVLGTNVISPVLIAIAAPRLAGASGNLLAICACADWLKYMQ